MVSINLLKKTGYILIKEEIIFWVIIRLQILMQDMGFQTINSYQ